MSLFAKVFANQKPVIGMVHLKALPGAPSYAGSMEAIYDAALKDLQALEAAGASAVIVENFGDVPYATTNALITYTAMAALVARLLEVTALPLGVNVQFNACEAEWAIAYSCGADFIRAEVLAENRVGPNGVCIAAGPELARMRAAFPADIAVLADIQVKHTFALVEQPVDFTVHSLVEAGADAIICSGLLTGKSPSLEEVSQIKEYAGELPVLVGSGVNAGSIAQYLSVADGAIVGSSIKVDGVVENPVDPDRASALIKAARMDTGLVGAQSKAITASKV